MSKHKHHADSWDAFEERFLPVFRPDTTVLWQKEELPPQETVNYREWWTVIDCDGRLYLSAGFRYVNRLAYVRCERPWTDADLYDIYRYEN